MLLITSPACYRSRAVDRILGSIPPQNYVNLSLFVAGSIHQGHGCFNDVSRDRQCSFMIFFSTVVCSVTASCAMADWIELLMKIVCT